MAKRTTSLIKILGMQFARSWKITFEQAFARGSWWGLRATLSATLVAWLAGLSRSGDLWDVLGTAWIPSRRSSRHRPAWALALLYELWKLVP